MARTTWLREFRAWIEDNGLDPAEADKGTVARAAFEAGWHLGRAALKNRGGA